MHLALFLFAGGLCVYLWDIHIGVAVPVVLLTSITVLIYIAVLVLPLIYDYCPYATALSKLIKPYPGTWSRQRDRQPDNNVSSDKVPMDATTSRTLAWMISNSEVPKSVDHAVQAIAGTSFEMPNEALWECNVSWKVHLYLRGQIEDICFVTTEVLKRLELADSRRFSEVLACAQTLNLVAVERREHAKVSPGDRPRNAAGRLWLCEGFYSSLCRHESLHMKAVGYAARAIVAQDGKSFYNDKYNHLLDVSELAVLALQQQSPPHPTLCHIAFTALRSEATGCDPSSLELATQQSQILHNMIAIVCLVVEKHQLSSEFARAVCAVGLSLNRQNDALVGKAATHFFASDDQVEYLQRLGDSCAVWGLCGLLCALESDPLLMSMQESELEPVFQSLSTYVVKKKGTGRAPWKRSG
ncbi:hypothetical protein BDV93DRAFT_558433 [Ceratobasidium sp. AG-I]|nr:hypothetical protein BDV93DRAFT_558433 [Ceratobasidium sp. AG-I]